MTLRAGLKIDMVVDSDQWKAAKGVRSMVQRAVTRAAAFSRSARPVELAIVLTDDSAIRLLNRQWRGIDSATNVLSFPAKNGRLAQPPGAQPHLGDIVLAFETIAREARGEHKPFVHHVAHLAVHGFLHLIGYDHERDDEALAMEQAERDILRQLAIPDPYGAAAKPTRKAGDKRRSRRGATVRRKKTAREHARKSRNSS